MDAAKPGAMEAAESVAMGPPVRRVFLGSAAMSNIQSNFTPAALPGVMNTSTAVQAFQHNSLGVGFSGSGFLILYFTGVAAVLQSLGIINNNTRLAGSSGGAITAAALCSNIPAATQQFATNINITTTCRANKGCRGILNSVVRSSFSNLLAAGKDSAPKSTRVAADRLPGAATGSSSAVTRPVTGWCGSKLFITVTHARPANATDLPLLVSNFSFVQQLVDAVAASAYLPFLSGASAVTRYDGLTVYDGGFSYPLPCPPGVSYCVKVSSGVRPAASTASPSAAGTGSGPNSTTRTASAALEVLTAAANLSDAASAAFIPLNPQALPAPQPDIYPGLSGPLSVPAEEWNSYGLSIPDNATLRFIYNQGRQDAVAWASKAGFGEPAKLQAVLRSTAAPSDAVLLVGPARGLH